MITLMHSYPYSLNMSLCPYDSCSCTLLHNIIGVFLCEIGVGLGTEEEEGGGGLTVEVEVEDEEEKGEEQGCRGGELEQLREVAGGGESEGVDEQVGGVEEVEGEQAQEGEVVGLGDAAVEELAVVVEVHRAVPAPPAVVAPLQHQRIAQHAEHQRRRRMLLLVAAAAQDGVHGVRPQNAGDFVEDEGETDVVVEQEGEGEPVQLPPPQLRLRLVGVVLDEEEADRPELLQRRPRQSAHSAHQQNRPNITHRCSESYMQSGSREIRLRPICHSSSSPSANSRPFLPFTRSSTDLIHPSTPLQCTTQFMISDTPPRIRNALMRKKRVRQLRCSSVQKNPILCGFSLSWESRRVVHWLVRRWKAAKPPFRLYSKLQIYQKAVPKEMLLSL